MNTLRNVGRDTVLTTEQGLVIKQAAVEAARRKFVGRKLFSAMRKIDAGSQTYGYDTKTHVSAAAFDYAWPGKMAQDIMNFARTTVPIPILHKETSINKLDLLASQLSGTPLNTSNIDSIAYQVAWAEDLMLLNGWSQDGTTYEINGLYQVAGNSEASSLDYGTPANIVTSINNAKGLLESDNIFAPYNLVLNPTQHQQLFPLIANTAVSYLQWVQQALEGGSIYVSPAVVAGTGLMVEANNSGSMEYVVAEDLSTETEQKSVEDGAGLFARVYVRGLPVIYDANAICKLTTI